MDVKCFSWVLAGLDMLEGASTWHWHEWPIVREYGVVIWYLCHCAAIHRKFMKYSSINKKNPQLVSVSISSCPSQGKITTNKKRSAGMKAMLTKFSFNREKSASLITR